MGERRYRPPGNRAGDVGAGGSVSPGLPRSVKAIRCRARKRLERVKGSQYAKAGTEVIPQQSDHQISVEADRSIPHVFMTRITVRARNHPDQLRLEQQAPSRFIRGASSRFLLNADLTGQDFDTRLAELRHRVNGIDDNRRRRSIGALNRV